MRMRQISEVMQCDEDEADKEVMQYDEDEADKDM